MKRKILCLFISFIVLINSLSYVSYAETLFSSGIYLEYPDVWFFWSNKDLPGVPKGSEEQFAKELGQWSGISDSFFLKKALQVSVPVDYYVDENSELPSSIGFIDNTTVLKAMKDILFIESMQESIQKWEDKYYNKTLLDQDNIELGALVNNCYSDLDKILTEYTSYQKDTSNNGVLLTIEWVNQITGVNNLKNKITGNQSAVKYLNDIEKFTKFYSNNNSFMTSVAGTSGLNITPKQLMDSVKKNLLKSISSQLISSFGKDFTDSADLTKSAYALITAVIKKNSVAAVACSAWDTTIKGINIMTDKLTDADNYCITIYDILNKDVDKDIDDPKLVNILNNGPNNTALFDKDWNGFSYDDYKVYLGDYIPYGFMVYNMANPLYQINQSSTKLYKSVEKNIRSNAKSLVDEFSSIQSQLLSNNAFGNVNCNRTAINTDVQTIFSIKTLNTGLARQNLVDYINALDKHTLTKSTTGGHALITSLVRVNDRTIILNSNTNKIVEACDNNTEQTAIQLTKRTEVEGSLLNDDIDFYKIILTENGFLNINFSAYDDLDASLNLGDYVLKSNNSVVTNGEIFLEAGTYYLNVVPNITYSADYNGNYKVLVEFFQESRDTSSIEYSLNITSSNGLVTKTPDKLSYQDGEEVLLTVIPNEGYMFKQWEGDVTSTSINQKVIMTGDKIITAVFEKSLTADDIINTPYAEIAEIEDNNEFIRAQIIPAKSIITGEHTSIADVDYYKITVPEDGYFYMEANTSGCIVDFLFYNEDLSQKSYGIKAHSTKSTIEGHLDQGIHYISVRPTGTTEPGNYFFKFKWFPYSFSDSLSDADVENNNSILTSQKINLGDKINGRITRFDLDFYEIDISSAGYLELDFQADYLFGTLYSSLYDSNNKILASYRVENDNGTGTNKIWVNEGKYYILISSNFFHYAGPSGSGAGAIGIYSFSTNFTIYEGLNEIESYTNSKSLAQNIEFGEQIYGMISLHDLIKANYEGAPKDWYKIVFPFDGEVSIEFTSNIESEETNKTELALLYITDGNIEPVNSTLVYTVSGNSISSEKISRLVAGTYYVRVTSPQYKAGSYNFIINYKADNNTTFKIGDYIEFGRYYNEPLLWKITKINEDGSISLWTDKIITIKAFDAPELNNDYGSNRWESSNIREWLNGSMIVNYSTQPPKDDIPTSWNGSASNGDYSTEPGFLSNFTDYEISLIQPMMNKCILSSNDASESDGGSEVFKLSSDYGIWNSLGPIANYDNAYYENVTDLIYIPDLLDIYLSSGDSYLKGTTQKAIDYAGFPANWIVKPSENYMYWLRTPGDDYNLFYQSNYGKASSIGSPYGTLVGIVPALTLNNKTQIIAGNGNYDNPYKISDENLYSINIINKNGYVTNQQNKTVFTRGETVTLTAKPKEGYKFIAWSGDIHGSDATISFEIDSNKEIIATFQKISNIPTNLRSTFVNETSTSLKWDAATAKVKGYKVYRDGVLIATLGSTITNYNAIKLASAKLYVFSVRSYDFNGTLSDMSNNVEVTTLADVESPITPTNLRSATSTETTINLSWNAATDNVGVKGYEIYRDGVKISSTSKLEYVSKGLIPGKTYSYMVKAYDAAGNKSEDSNTISVTTVPDPIAPTSAVNLVSTASTETTVSLSWEAAADNISVKGYEIYRDGVKITSTSKLMYVNTGRIPGKTYTYTVRAYDAAGNKSEESNTISVTTLPDPIAPSAPTNLISSGSTETTVSLVWEAASDNIAVKGYEIYRDGVRISSTSKLVYINTGLIPGKTYNYTVKTYDLVGNKSEESNVITVTTLPDTVIPTKVENLTVTGTTESTVTLNWSPASDNVKVVGYQIYRNGVKIATTSLTSYTNSKLKVGTTYTYTIVAYDRSGNLSDISESVVINF